MQDTISTYNGWSNRETWLRVVAECRTLIINHISPQPTV